jgi:hypothetical protein
MNHNRLNSASAAKQLPVLLTFVLLLAASSVCASTFTTKASGNWNSTNTWTPSGIPGLGDDIIIQGGYNVTVTTNTSVNSIIFGSYNGVQTLTVNSGAILAVVVDLNAQCATGNWSIYDYIAGGGAINCASVTVGAGSLGASDYIHTVTLTSTISNLNVSSDLNINGVSASGAFSDSIFTFSSGAVSVAGSVSVNAVSGTTSAFTMANGSAMLNLSSATGPYFSTSGPGPTTVTLNGLGATVNYSGTNQTVQPIPYPYENLGFTGDGTDLISGAITVPGSVTIGAGCAADVGSGSTFDIGGLLIGPGTLQDTSGGVIGLNSSLTNSANLSIASGATIGFSLGASASMPYQQIVQTAGNVTLDSGANVVISNTAGTLTGAYVLINAGGAGSSYGSGPQIPAAGAAGVNLSFASGSVSSNYVLTLDPSNARLLDLAVPMAGSSITGITRNAGGSVTLTYNAVGGFTYDVQYATNLDAPANWITIAGGNTNPLVTGPISFTDINAAANAAGGQIFYRAVSP